MNEHREYLLAKGKLTRYLQRHRKGPDVKPVEPGDWQEFRRLMIAEREAHVAAFGR